MNKCSFRVYYISRNNRFQYYFQKNLSPLFVEFDEFPGGQMTGPEESLFFVYAAQVLEVLRHKASLVSSIFIHYNRIASKSLWSFAISTGHR